MKKLLPLLLFILIGCSEPEPLNYGLLVERDGVHYRTDTNEIYSGPVFNIDGKSEGTLKKGKFHGTIKSYHSKFFTFGQLKEEGTYKDGKLVGSYKYYHKNGQIKGETIYKDGKLDGPYRFYHSNEQLDEEGTYKDGKLDGPFKSYYDNGQLQQETTYKDGKVIESKTY